MALNTWALDPNGKETLGFVLVIVTPPCPPPPMKILDVALRPNIFFLYCVTRPTLEVFFLLLRNFRKKLRNGHRKS